jgi:hypothetical protein
MVVVRKQYFKGLSSNNLLIWGGDFSNYFRPEHLVNDQYNEIAEAIDENPSLELQKLLFEKSNGLLGKTLNLKEMKEFSKWIESEISEGKNIFLKIIVYTPSFKADYTTYFKLQFTSSKMDVNNADYEKLDNFQHEFEVSKSSK